MQQVRHPEKPKRDSSRIYGSPSALEIAQERPDVVQQIFDRLAGGASTPALAVQLNAIGLPSPGGSSRG